MESDLFVVQNQRTKGIISSRFATDQSSYGRQVNSSSFKLVLAIPLRIIVLKTYPTPQNHGQRNQ